MKRFFFAVMIMACSNNSYPQNLTELNFLSQLPRTTDDFQKYQFDYELENLQSHLPSAPFGIDSPIAANFDGTGIFPFEHNCQVKDIECSLLKTRNGKDVICYAVKESFDAKGQFNDFWGKCSYNGMSWWSDGIKKSMEGQPLEIAICIPNPYMTYIYPSKNSKGLITNIGDDLVYSYDSKDRVIEVNHSSGNYSYKYEYFGDSKNIERIKVYLYNKIRGEVKYTYSSRKITAIVGKLFYENGHVENEFHKTYTYDGRGGVSGMKHVKIDVTGSKLHHDYTFNNSYDENGKIVTSIVSKRFYRSGLYEGNLNKPMRFTRSYTYDNKGNWIRIDDDLGHCVIRNIDYNISSAPLHNNDGRNNRNFNAKRNFKISNDNWFCFGTRSELEEQKIISGNTIITKSVNWDYYIKIDKNVDKELKFYSKNAKVLTPHPDYSYRLVLDNKKQYKMVITDPDAFWRESSILVVLVTVP